MTREERLLQRITYGSLGLSINGKNYHYFHYGTGRALCIMHDTKKGTLEGWKRRKDKMTWWPICPQMVKIVVLAGFPRVTLTGRIIYAALSGS